MLLLHACILLGSWPDLLHESLSIKELINTGDLISDLIHLQYPYIVSSKSRLGFIIANSLDFVFLLPAVIACY